MQVLDWLYTVLFLVSLSFILFRHRFFRQFGLTPSQVTGIFCLKVMAGILYGVIHLQRYGGADTWQYFRMSGLIFEMLQEGRLWDYLNLSLGINYRGENQQRYGDVFGYWNDMGSYFMIRFHSLARLISFGNYYVHVVIYNFVTLIGILYLYRFFINQVAGNRAFIAAIVFLFPSILFWSSGIHKDGICLMALGLILFAVDAWISGSGKFLKTSGMLTAGVLLLFIIRNYWLFLLLPLLAAYIITRRYQLNAYIVFSGILLVSGLIAQNLQWIQPSWNLMSHIGQVQNEFLGRARNTVTVVVPFAGNSFKEVVRSFPLAYLNTLIEPLPKERNPSLHWLIFLENLLVLAFTITGFARRQRKPTSRELALVLFCFSFSLILLWIIGISVPVLGAVIRYRMPAILLLLIAVLTLQNPLGKEITTLRKSFY